MLACFPDEPVNQALAEKIGFLTSNAIYKETIEAAGKK
jgi:hypothetical protein